MKTIHAEFVRGAHTSLLRAVLSVGTSSSGDHSPHAGQSSSWDVRQPYIVIFGIGSSLSKCNSPISWVPGFIWRSLLPRPVRHKDRAESVEAHHRDRNTRLNHLPEVLPGDIHGISRGSDSRYTYQSNCNHHGGETEEEAQDKFLPDFHPNLPENTDGNGHD